MADITLKVPALDKLLDYVASGVGAIAGPLLAPWRASQEGKARVNTAKADVDVQRIKAAAESSTLQLIAKEQAEARKYVATSDKPESDGDIIRLNDVQKAMEFQAKKRFTNVRALVGHAVEELGDTEVPDHDPGPDWTARFFDGAQDVSSEELQKLWGKILAGEVKSPGQTSLRTLSILRDMTQQEARDFSTLMRFRISNFILGDALQRVLGQDSNSFVLHFSDIGLLGTLGETSNITLGDDGKSWIAEHYFSTISWIDAIQDSPSITPGGYGKWQIAEHYGHVLIIEGQPGPNLGSTISVGLNTFLITTAGLELAKFCQHDPDFLYLSHFASHLARLGCKLKIAKIVSQDAEDYQTYDEQVIKPFDETEEHNQEESNNGE